MVDGVVEHLHLVSELNHFDEVPAWKAVKASMRMLGEQHRILMALQRQLHCMRCCQQKIYWIVIYTFLVMKASGGSESDD